MELDLVFHGGMCCGIKTIQGFPYSYYSGEVCPPKEASRRKDNDSHGDHVSSSMSFFTDSAPKESIEARFARLVSFCKRVRPQGTIEVALARSRYSGGFDQNKSWGRLLRKHKFKKTVKEFLNSNSGNYVTIYHLVYDTVAEKAKVNTPSSLPNPFRLG